MSALVELKNNIERLDKNYQIEVLYYLYKLPQIKLNENENGIFINIGLLEKDQVIELQNKVNIFKSLENILNEPKPIIDMIDDAP